MNLGGDPGRDDNGLPPVDIEIPDDARELDRDVQAYHRELRALRRRRLARRLHAPLTRDGMVLPLLAGCLALTLVAGTLLTVFTGGQPAAPMQPAASARLPNANVLVDGVQTPLSDLNGSVLVLVPPHCDCAHLGQLVGEAFAAGVQIYLVGTRGVQVTALAKRTGLSAAQAAEDTGNALDRRYHPVRLTAILVAVDGSVARVVSDHGHGFQLAGTLRSLVHGGPYGLPARGTAGTPAIAAGLPGR